MNHMYLPVKVLDKCWADELMQGHVFMRALEEFGGWKIVEDGELGGAVLDNDYRGDVGEGFVRNLAPEESDPIFDCFSKELKNVMIQRGYIDDAERATRIFSMARLEYDIETRNYKKISPEFAQFGDTAVIITDPEEFYRRVVAFYHRAFENNFIVEIGEITYKDIFQDYGEWGIYTKEKKYSWQQEVRIAARLRPDLQNLRKDKPEPITADIGDLSDIAIEIPIQDLLDGTWSGDLFEKKLLKRMEECKVPEDGITDETWIIMGDFRDIGPYDKWINFWKDGLCLENWEAVTRMESFPNGTISTPRLEFIEKSGGGRLIFHYNSIEIHEEIVVCGNTDIKKRLLDILEQQFSGRYIPMEYVCNLKLGEISAKYDRKNMLSESFGRHWMGMFCIYQLEKTMIRYRNIFGLDFGEPCWRMTIRCKNSNYLSAIAFMKNVQRTVQEMVDYLEGEVDVYERYHSL